MVELWRSDFSAFYRDMGPCPPGHTLDRIKNDGPYGPGNCRWAQPRTQSNNTRRNKTMVHGGRTLTFAQWAREVGVPPIALWLRVNRYGWSVERALTTPVLQHREHHTTKRGACGKVVLSPTSAPG